MSTLDTLASKLADDTIEAMKITGEERLFVEVGELIGASSQTLEEAYLTEIRIRLADRAARKFLATKVAAAKRTASAPPSA
ncbi:hypothetical protein [Sedimentitalea todarodis]|uniref:Uncharacterized protein n=1 Tax=Sedimentitalea todarodis TaxID=1631240 RepID=A0ABU3VC18_9RHOB|nr:hypothetical protein [Sedimentitalea todarodis]MDU9003709.1 hypothetical protein [Sedimentitalea todarodis]